MGFHEGFLSEIIGKTAVVVGPGGHITIGRVTDFVVTQPHDTFPKIDALVIKARSGHYLAPTDTLVDFEPNRVSLSAAPTQAPPPDDEALYLVEDLFDKQIVDVDGRKVVRINDIEVARTGGALARRRRRHRLSAASCAGSAAASFPRRSVDADPAHADRLGQRRAAARPQPRRRSSSRSRETGSRGCIPPTSPRSSATSRRTTPPASSARSTTKPPPTRSNTSMPRRSARSSTTSATERAADIIEEMDSDDAADLLGDLPEEQQEQLLARWTPRRADDLRELVAIRRRHRRRSDDDRLRVDLSAPHGRRDDREDPRARAGDRVHLLPLRDRPIGETARRALACARCCSRHPTPRSTRHGDATSSASIPTPRPTDVASTIARYDLLACPVLDETGKMLGIVTVDDAIDAIIPERLKKQLPRFTKHQHQERLEQRMANMQREHAARWWRAGCSGASGLLACSGRASSRPPPATTSAASRPTRRPARSSATSILWTLVPLTVSLIVVQEMAARMGAVTGQGSCRTDPRELRSPMDGHLGLAFVRPTGSRQRQNLRASRPAAEIFHVSRFIAIPLAAVAGLLLDPAREPKDRRSAFSSFPRRSISRTSYPG